jgi:nitrogen regulatory protein PII
MKVNNKEELNQAIINVIQKILNTGASSKGDVFDQTVSFLFKFHFVCLFILS